MNYFGVSDKGQYRAENQDCFDILAVSGGVLAVVCDGMGGAAGGSMASEMAVTRFMAFARAALEASDGDDPAEALRQAVDAANRKVFRCAELSEEYVGMGTTLVAGYWQGDTAFFVNVGDSRAYRMAKDGIVQVTRDHSLVQQMIDKGEITPAQGRHHPRRNLITRAIGGGRLVTCDEFTMPIREGDRFLLCSDGLTNSLEDAEMHRVLLAEDNAESACRKLVQEALESGARDNVTAAVIYAVKGGA